MRLLIACCALLGAASCTTSSAAKALRLADAVGHLTGVSETLVGADAELHRQIERLEQGLVPLDTFEDYQEDQDDRTTDLEDHHDQPVSGDDWTKIIGSIVLATTAGGVAVDRVRTGRALREKANGKA